MEYVWFLAAALALLYIQYRRNESRRRRLQIQRLKEQWGQVPDREYGEGDLVRIRRYSQKFQGAEYVIDDITWNDLDLDDIFMLLNHTNSSVGEEVLYQVLRTPCTDIAVLQERNRLAGVFTREPELRLELEKRLSRIGRTGRQALCDYIVNLSEQPCRPNRFHYLGLTFLAASLAGVVLKPEIGIPALVGVIVFQMITYYQQKAQVETYFSCVSQIVRLAVYGREVCHLPDAEALSLYLRSLKQHIRELEPFCHKARLITMGSAMGGSPFDLLADYVKMLLHTDLIAYNQIIRMTKEREAAIWKVVEILGQLECGLAIASFRACLGQWCEPRLVGETNATYLHGEGLYHPLVNQAVPNTIDALRSQLITGSNASGKSTFLKTVALSAVLAQTVYTVPGADYEAPLYQIYTSMALRDSLVAGESYYMAEIRSLKRILERGEDSLPVLCFVDEVLRGTNTVERIAASAQILKSMSQMNLLCFAATHDGELTYLLEPWYENGHFSEEIADGDVRFSYRLERGRSKSRNALKLLEWMGYEESVLSDAQAMAERFEQTGIWNMDGKEEAHERAGTEIHRDGTDRNCRRHQSDIVESAAAGTHQ